MQSSSKRTVQVNVKMSVEDFALLKKAAETFSPNALLTNSSIVLGLAKLGSAQRRQGAAKLLHEPAGKARNAEEAH